MDSLLASIRDLKAELDRLRPLSPGALTHLQMHYDVELTYTSNAIEGNTLTYRETAEVIEHGITVGGKSLREHLEAVDHYDALQWMRSQVERTGGHPLLCVTEDTVRELHRRIVLRSLPAMAGVCSPYPRRIAGSAVVFPNPAKVPVLMGEFGAWLASVTGGAQVPNDPAWSLVPGARVAHSPDAPELAFLAHVRLTAIQPFGDGNGRAARLLMNLLLLRQGYPPVPIGPGDRRDYLAAQEHGSVREDLGPFQRWMHERLAATLTGYVDVLGET